MAHTIGGKKHMPKTPEFRQMHKGGGKKRGGKRSRKKM